MRTCSPIEFVNRWMVRPRPVMLLDSLPQLPDDCLLILREQGLPSEVRIVCYNDLTLKFNQALIPLESVWKHQQALGYKLSEMPAEWTRFWHLGDSDYLQGSAWICLEEQTGSLFAIDLDLPQPVYLINSSLASFYTTLNHLLTWSQDHNGNRNSLICLKSELLQCSISMDELSPFWLNIIEATLDNGNPILAFRVIP